MTWTYSGDPADSARDAVRFLLGDTDTTNQRVTDEEIAYALTQTANDTYGAAAYCARALVGKYANMVDTDFESVGVKYSQLRENYSALAIRLDAQAKRYGSKGLGVPAAGGISVSAMDAADELSDRVQPKFKRDQFAWPGRDVSDEQL